MKNTLVVVAELGGFKAYKVENNNHLAREPRLEILEQYDNAEAHGHLVDKVSDLSGRFPRGTGTKAGGAMADGERHNIELETRRRLVRQLAQRLNTMARGQQIERCFLAASKEINHQLLEELDPQLRAKIEKNIPADLTKLERAEILRRF
jgi:Protein required for attachment to host cells